MPSSFTSNVAFEKPANGEKTGTWGETVNDNMDILDRLTSQVGSIALTSSTYTLTTSTTGSLTEGHYSTIKFTGTPGATCTVAINPNTVQRIYLIQNTTNQTVIMSQGSGSTVSIAAGKSAIVYCDGAGSSASVSNASSGFVTGTLSDIGALTPTDGNFIVGNGTTWVAESGNTALTSLGVTATATELNVLDGITASTAELNILDGVTATASELNVLDGITATTTELNYTDGVTSNIQTQINTKAATSTTISAGAGLTGGGDLSANRTISHADTSSQSSVNNSGDVFIQDITLDTYGHVTGITSAEAKVAYFVVYNSSGGIFASRGFSSVTLSGATATHNFSTAQSSSTSYSIAGANNCTGSGIALVSGETSSSFEITWQSRGSSTCLGSINRVIVGR